MIFSKFLNKEVRPHKDAWVVIFCVLVFILLRLPSLVEPYWYGDEGIYQVIGKALNSGWVLYRDIWDNKPPILYLIYAIFNGDQFLVRTFSLIVGAFSVISFYFLGKRILVKKASVVVSTLLYSILFGSPLFEGNIANAENFMHLPILLSAIFIFRSNLGRNKKLLFISGIFLSLAVMIKMVAVFEFSAFLVFIALVSSRERSILSKLNLKKYLYLTLGFISLPIFFMVYFLAQNALPDFISGVFSENISYVGVENNFIVPMGMLIFNLIVITFVLVLAYKRRKKLSPEYLFIILWVVFGYFSTNFSQRPYLHYVLMSIIPLSFLVGKIIDYEGKKKPLMAIILVVIGITIYLKFGYYEKTVSYYRNYIDFMFFEKGLENYQSFFDRNTPRDYDLARFINRFSENDKRNVFLWSDSSQIYALSDTLPPGKYVVAYHITYYNNAIPYMINQIEKTEPKYIIKTKDSPEFRRFLPSYVLKYRIRDASIYERQD